MIGFAALDKNRELVLWGAHTIFKVCSKNRVRTRFTDIEKSNFSSRKKSIYFANPMQMHMHMHMHMHLEQANAIDNVR